MNQTPPYFILNSISILLHQQLTQNKVKASHFTHNFREREGEREDE